MSSNHDLTVEEFLEKFKRDDFDINYEDPNTKLLLDALTAYQLEKLHAHIAISNAMSSGAVKSKEGKRGESPEKTQAKPKIDPLEEVKQEFIKYVQEHPPRPIQNQTATTPVNISLKVVYDIVKNAPPEKQNALNRFVDSIKNHPVFVGQITAQAIGQIIGKLMEFVESYHSSN
jgi:hypothetical protein